MREELEQLIKRLEQYKINYLNGNYVEATLSTIFGNLLEIAERFLAHAREPEQRRDEFARKVALAYENIMWGSQSWRGRFPEVSERWFQQALAEVKKGESDDRDNETTGRRAGGNTL